MEDSKIRAESCLSLYVSIRPHGETSPLLHFTVAKHEPIGYDVRPYESRNDKLFSCLDG